MLLQLKPQIVFKDWGCVEAACFSLVRPWVPSPGKKLIIVEQQSSKKKKKDPNIGNIA